MGPFPLVYLENGGARNACLRRRNSPSKRRLQISQNKKGIYNCPGHTENNYRFLLMFKEKCSPRGRPPSKLGKSAGNPRAPRSVGAFFERPRATTGRPYENLLNHCFPEGKPAVPCSVGRGLAPPAMDSDSAEIRPLSSALPSLLGGLPLGEGGGKADG